MNAIIDNLNTIKQATEEQSISLDKVDYITKQICYLTTEDALSILGDNASVGTCKELYNKQRDEFNILCDMLLDYIQPSIEKNKTILETTCTTLKEI